MAAQFSSIAMANSNFLNNKITRVIIKQTIIIVTTSVFEMPNSDPNKYCCN